MDTEQFISHSPTVPNQQILAVVAKVGLVNVAKVPKSTLQL